MTTPESPFGPWEPYVADWDDGIREYVWACRVECPCGVMLVGEIELVESPAYLVMHDDGELQVISSTDFDYWYDKLAAITEKEEP